MQMYFIYALIDPRYKAVRYVGQTRDVYKRFLKHINCSDSNFAKNAWLMELRSLNKMVIMETLEEVSNLEKALEREQYWIKHFQVTMHPVMNIQHKYTPRKSEDRGYRDYGIALAAFNAGNTTARKLATALSTPNQHVGKDKALQIIREMREKKIIS
jgi:hypothetical protein